MTLQRVCEVRWDTLVKCCEVLYYKSINGNVCSFCLYCTVFNFGSLDTLTPHCCLNVTGCVLFSVKNIYIHIYLRTRCLFIISLIRQCCFLHLIQFRTSTTIIYYLICWLNCLYCCTCLNKKHIFDFHYFQYR